MAQIDRVLRSNLKLRHLQMLVALDQFHHLGRAAEFLSLTQPAVSKTLAEIESLFGLPLFERSTRGTQPTAAGASVVRFARSVLAGYERTRDEIAAEASGASGRTSVGAMVSSGTNQLSTRVARTPTASRSATSVRAHHRVHHARDPVGTARVPTGSGAWSVMVMPAWRPRRGSAVSDPPGSRASP